MLQWQLYATGRCIVIYLRDLSLNQLDSLNKLSLNQKSSVTTTRVDAFNYIAPIYIYIII